MNQHIASPAQTQYPIASPRRLSQPGALPQASRPIRALRNRQYAIRPVADSETDEESLRDLASQIALSRPELFCLLAVAPDELEAVFDGFLS